MDGLVKITYRSFSKYLFYDFKIEALALDFIAHVADQCSKH